MASDLIVRDLESGDLDALLSLYAHLNPADEPLPAPDEVRRIWTAILDDPAHVYLGAFEGGVLISVCNATIVPNLTRGARPYALIENVVTHDEYRRKGAGSRVMRELIERCRARRCYKVMLMSAMRRADIHAFYEALGFDKHEKQAFVIKMP